MIFPHGIYEANSFMFNTPVGFFSLQQKEFNEAYYSKGSNGSLKASKHMKIQFILKF